MSHKKGTFKHSEQTKQKLREKAKVQFESEEARQAHGQIIKERMSSDEVKQKLSKAQLERFENLDERAKAASYGFSGKQHTDETITKMSESALIRFSDPEEIKKVSFRNQGREYSDETKEKMSQSGLRKWENEEFRSKVMPKILSNLKKAGRGKRGIYISQKVGEIQYRSSYEKRCYELLDKREDVLTYEAEPFYVEYITQDKLKRYYPDLKVIYKDLSFEIWEIKPQFLLDKEDNPKKFEAARKEFGDKFKVITENDLFP